MQRTKEPGPEVAGKKGRRAQGFAPGRRKDGRVEIRTRKGVTDE